MIDTRLVPDEQAVITPGEAVAAMIRKGLGCANRPVSCTPQCVANTPLALLWREGIEAERCNRFQRGRTLEEASAYGCALLCEALALAICAHAGIARRVPHLDTPRLSLPGAYVPDSDEHARPSPHGSSQDHRPALKQAVVALLGSQDGGIPCVSKNWDGNTSDTQVFQQRAEALRRAVQDTPSPRSLVADAPLSGADHATPLATLGFLTRLPATLKWVSQVLRPALQWDTWPPVDPPPLSAADAGSRWPGPALGGGVGTGSSWTCCSHAEESHTARTRGHHPAALAPARPTLLRPRSGSVANHRKQES
jgi:transposase